MSRCGHTGLMNQLLVGYARVARWMLIRAVPNARTWQPLVARPLMRRNGSPRESDVTDTIQPMAHLRCDFFSETLALSTSMTVILPQATSTQIGMTGRAGTEPPPVLYLLHGLSDDHTIWLRRTSIERYVAPLGLAVGEEVAGSEHDLFALLDRTPAAELPPLYLCCGTEDPL